MYSYKAVRGGGTHIESPLKVVDRVHHDNGRTARAKLSPQPHLAKIAAFFLAQTRNNNVVKKALKGCDCDCGCDEKRRIAINN